MLVKIPDYVEEILVLLRNCGYKAYVVGGCVRDSLLGIVPSDWDIATDAVPLKVMKALNGKKIIPTGIKHGTVTVVNCEKYIEVTTFRLENGYRDNRHPDSVSFKSTLSEDLKRRDFTVNAMCIDENGEIIDMFGGRDDLNSRTLRTIGEPSLRFSEDSLRILRALRFAARYKMKIEPKTSEAIFKNKHRLAYVSNERIMCELLKIIKAPYCEKVLLEYKDIIFEIIPELRATDGVFQRQDYHCYDVWEHIVHAVGAIEPKNHLRLTMLLHDVGKPKCADGRGHFKGHAYKGAEISDKILRRMKCSNKMRQTVVKLVRLHNMVAENTDEALRKLLYRYHAETMIDLIKIFKADNMAKRPEIAKARVEYYNKVEQRLNKIIASNPPFIVKNLAVKGQDIIELGVEKGPNVGKVLSALNKMVAQNLIKNQKYKLIEAARQIILEDKIKTVKNHLQNTDNNDII